ncbi:hypothetical protein ACFL0T_05450 [Candidatus Omnitrophota bacterium]
MNKDREREIKGWKRKRKILRPYGLRMSSRKAEKLLDCSIILSIISAVLFYPGVSLSDNTSMKFSISSDNSEYKIRKPIMLTYTLKNNGKEEVFVSNRFFTGSETSRNRDVFLKVTSPANEELTCKYSHPTGIPRTDNFIILAPNAQIKSGRKYNALAYFDFKEPGAYKIVGVYENKFGEEIGLDTFKERIESEPITITIVE